MEKLILDQYKKFNKEINLSFVDELISSRVFVFDEIVDNCLLNKDIYIGDIEKIEWREDGNGNKIPFVDGKRIKGIRCFDDSLKGLIGA